MFNNLVIYDQHIPQSSLQSIVPDLATAWMRKDYSVGLNLQGAADPDQTFPQRAPR